MENPIFEIEQGLKYIYIGVSEDGAIISSDELDNCRIVIVTAFASHEATATKSGGYFRIAVPYRYYGWAVFRVIVQCHHAELGDLTFTTEDGCKWMKGSDGKNAVLIVGGSEGEIVIPDTPGLIDDEPTEGSRNLVRSGGVWAKIQECKRLTKADWQEDDDTQGSYVYNRTHYYTEVATAVVAAVTRDSGRSAHGIYQTGTDLAVLNSDGKIYPIEITLGNVTQLAFYQYVGTGRFAFGSYRFLVTETVADDVVCGTLTPEGGANTFNCTLPVDLEEETFDLTINAVNVKQLTDAYMQDVEAQLSGCVTGATYNSNRKKIVLTGLDSMTIAEIDTTLFENENIKVITAEATLSPSFELTISNYSNVYASVLAANTAGKIPMLRITTNVSVIINAVLSEVGADTFFGASQFMNSQMATLRLQSDSYDFAIVEYQNKLISGQNIKTVNGNSLVGSGDVTIASGVQSDWDEDDTESLAYINNKPSVYTQAQTNALLFGKQDKLISGQNIKTINGNSMVGDGNLIITGETVVVDGYPTKDSMNPVASGGVYDALESESVTQDVTLSAGYISLQSNIGKTISTDITDNSYYACAAVEVHQGETVVMSGTDFNATVHLWGFLDTDKVLLSKSDGNNTKYTDLTMVVENDGWLIYNSLASNTANSLKITSTTKRNAFKSGQEIKEVSIVEGYEGGEDDVLSAATGAELNAMINKTIDHTSSIVSGYFNMNGLTVGSTMREQVLANATYVCVKIAVKKGDVALLTGTTFNATVRLYCVTDKENKILQIISSTNHNYVKEEVDITEDGFLYYSSTSANNANEILIVKSADSRLTNLEKSVNEIMRISPAMDVEEIYAADKKMRDLMRANANAGFFFFSDVHRSETNVARILALANAWAAEGKVDAVLNGGDTELENVGTSSSPVWSFGWFTDMMDECDVDVLTSIGNHDSAPYSGNPLSSFESDYTHFIAPQVSRYENIIQPTGASTNNLSYFYKDYNGVRVINFDTAYNWGDGTQEEEAAYLAAENEWLESVLSDARTNSKAVVIFTHYAFLASKSTTPDGCTFRTLGWDNAGESISESILTVVDDFINAGGTFVCWLTGHSHHDIFLKSTEHPSQCMVNIGSARYNNNGPNNIHRMVTTDQTSSDYDQFAYVTVDKERGLLSVMKMGSRIDKQLISRTSFVYDYINQTMVSNES